MDAFYEQAEFSTLSNNKVLINVEKTAISTGVAYSARLLLNDYKEGYRILDFGAGRLRNIKFLQKEQLRNISIIDTKKQVSSYKVADILNLDTVFNNINDLPDDYYNQVLCSYVLNVIPEKDIRQTIIEAIFKSLVKEGRLYLEVRRDKGILKNKHLKVFNDGYLIGSSQIKTFQKPFEGDELTSLLSKVGFSKVELIKRPDSYICIATK